MNECCWKRFHASPSKDIDGRLAVEVERRLDGFRVNVRELPRYRFVDFYRVAEHHCEAIGVKAAIESDHRDEYLGHSQAITVAAAVFGRSG